MDTALKTSYERTINAAGLTAAYNDRIVADTTSAAFSITLPAASDHEHRSELVDPYRDG
jgi:hypothetical protein